MCKLLHFPAPGDPPPEPPAASMRMPRPVGPALTDTVASHALAAPEQAGSQPAALGDAA
jgi:hypothetical protein